MRANVGNKLQVIVEQIRFLQAQAEKVLGEAKPNNDLHHGTCNCKKIPGNMYYMYERPNGQKYMSMISPKVRYHRCIYLYWMFILVMSATQRDIIRNVTQNVFQYSMSLYSLVCVYHRNKCC